MLDKYLTPHFRASEMRCRCRRSDCNAASMRPAFMQKLEALRVEWGAPLPTTSASRCTFWNDKVGGAPSSQHLLGNAADFNFSGPDEAARFAAMADKFGFGGIGLGRFLVHIDDRETPARWAYNDR